MNLVLIYKIHRHKEADNKTPGQLKFLAYNSWEHQTPETN